MLTEREPSPDDEAKASIVPPAAESSAPRDERREATRFLRESGTDFAVIWCDAVDEILVEVHDESLTGLGILVDSQVDIQLGRQFKIAYAGELLRGEVRHFEPQPNGQLLVGLSCQRLPRDESV